MDRIEIPRVKMNNGQEIPLLGLGTERTASKMAKLEDALAFAIKFGYRYIDAAWISFIDYALRNTVNLALNTIKLPRDELFMVCKLWNVYHSKQGVRQGFLDTMINVDTGLKYLDIYYINWPIGFKENSGVDPYPRDSNGKLMFSDVDYLETYHAIEELVDEDLVKGIGLCNFNRSQIEKVLSNSRIKPCAVQMEVHPYFQNEDLIEFCQNNGILVIATSPLGDGDLREFREDIPKLLEDKTLIQIGEKYHKSPAQVCLRWLIQRGCAAVPKTIEESQIVENACIFDFELSDEDMSEIKKLNKDLRIQTFPEAKSHKFYPFNEV